MSWVVWAVGVLAVLTILGQIEDTIRFRRKS